MTEAGVERQVSYSVAKSEKLEELLASELVHRTCGRLRFSRQLLRRYFALETLIVGGHRTLYDRVAGTRVELVATVLTRTDT